MKTWSALFTAIANELRLALETIIPGVDEDMKQQDKEARREQERFEEFILLIEPSDNKPPID